MGSEEKWAGIKKLERVSTEEFVSESVEQSGGCGVRVEVVRVVFLFLF